MECGDGTHCNGQSDGWTCCNIHGKRSKCPPNFPIMCANKGCWGDHCCQPTTQQCTQRNCSKYMKRVRIRDAHTSQECVNVDNNVIN